MREEAICNHCRFAFETTNPRFCRAVPHPAGETSLIITVNSGYE
jgi:hypothetical protein